MTSTPQGTAPYAQMLHLHSEGTMNAYGTMCLFRTIFVDPDQLLEASPEQQLVAVLLGGEAHCLETYTLRSAFSLS